MIERQGSGPRLATPDDFPDILDLVDRCFNHSSGGMASEWCHVYDREQPDRHAVITENGTVVSHVSIVEDELVIGDGHLQSWGISGVATEPRTRGQGYMSDLMDFWMERMDSAGVPFGKLGGDRKRYGHWGWERAGRERRYRVTERFFERDQVPDDARIERYDGSAEHITQLRDRYQRRNLRVRRDEEAWRNRLDRAQFTTLLRTDANEKGYLTFSRTRHNHRETTVSDLGGSPSTIRALLAHVFDTFGKQTIHVDMHPTDQQNRLFSGPDVSGYWEDRPHRMVYVGDLSQILAAYRNSIARRAAGANVPPGSISLEITEDGDPVALEWDGRSITVRAADHATVSVNRMAMARLLFWDPNTVPAYDNQPLLAATLPLGFYVPLVDRV